jgi:hypothetical protein
MSRLHASAISCSSFSAGRNSRGGAREAVHVLNPIQLLFDRLPQSALTKSKTAWSAIMRWPRATSAISNSGCLRWKHTWSDSVEHLD